MSRTHKLVHDVEQGVSGDHCRQDLDDDVRGRPGEEPCHDLAPHEPEDEGPGPVERDVPKGGKVLLDDPRAYDLVHGDGDGVVDHRLSLEYH